MTGLVRKSLWKRVTKRDEPSPAEAVREHGFSASDPLPARVLPRLVTDRVTGHPGSKRWYWHRQPAPRPQRPPARGRTLHPSERPRREIVPALPMDVGRRTATYARQRVPLTPAQVRRIRKKLRHASPTGATR